MRTSATHLRLVLDEGHEVHVGRENVGFGPAKQREVGCCSLAVAGQEITAWVCRVKQNALGL